jgi:hypothetical protein
MQCRRAALLAKGEGNAMYDPFPRLANKAVGRAMWSRVAIVRSSHLWKQIDR